MRTVIELKKNWKFYLDQPDSCQMPDFCRRGWKTVSIPHDWAIGGDFSAENDPQPMESSILDYQKGVIQIGRTGGLPVTGTGWYAYDLGRLDAHERYFVEFDGVMSRAEVFVNGKKAAYRPYGYSSFCIDMTDFLRFDGHDSIVVRVNALPATSRWYPGAGLYRPVRLVITEDTYIPYLGISILPEYSEQDQTAEVNIRVKVCGKEPTYQVYQEIFDEDGKSVGKASGEKTQIQIKAPLLWDISSPCLYTLVTEVRNGERVFDRISSRFGIRSICFDAREGFFLNGRSVKIHGVCLHHDSGMLGAAYCEDAVRRQMTKLKKMGCNALRTSHNPPAPGLLDICDELGILVMDEAFDEWKIPKVKNGYATLFEEWAETDLTDMIRRDRNHPCVIIYSIGNEIPDQVYPEGRKIARMLTQICHREDSSRPVSCGFNRLNAAIENGLTEEVDLVGLNYCAKEYERYHREHPEWKIIASETVSAVSSRGEYFFPAQIEMPVVKRDNLQVNSFDWSAPRFAYIPDIEFEAQDKCAFVAGEFVWTGFDYLGEPTPYREEWPSRSSYFGIFDLAGLPKDRYWAYAAKWSEKDVIHILPHWCWKEGELIDVHCYSNLPWVRLFLNGREMPMKERRGHRFLFGQIPFEAGELKAVGYRAENPEFPVCEDTVRTAGKPAVIRLIPEKTRICCGETAFIEVNIEDVKGNLCADSNIRIFFEVDGDGDYVASDAGDATSVRRFSESFCDCFHGKCVLAVRARERKGIIFVKACGDGMSGERLILNIV